MASSFRQGIGLLRNGRAASMSTPHSEAGPLRRARSPARRGRPASRRSALAARPRTRIEAARTARTGRGPRRRCRARARSTVGGRADRDVTPMRVRARDARRARRSFDRGDGGDDAARAVRAEDSAMSRMAWESSRDSPRRARFTYLFTIASQRLGHARGEASTSVGACPRRRIRRCPRRCVPRPTAPRPYWPCPASHAARRSSRDSRHALLAGLTSHRRDRRRPRRLRSTTMALAAQRRRTRRADVGVRQSTTS